MYMTAQFSNNTVNFILSRPFPNFEEYNYTKDNFKGYDGGVLVHCTHTIEAVNSIAREGLLLSNNRSNYFTWAVNPYTQVKYSKNSLNRAWRFGAGTVIFTVPSGVFVETENDTEFGIYGDIPIENIITIDIPLLEDSNIWLSDLPSVIKEYGVQTVKRVYYHKQFTPWYLNEENFFKLLDFGLRNSK